MKVNFSKTKTPTTNEEWRKKSDENRINIITKELKKNSLYKPLLNRSNNLKENSYENETNGRPNTSKKERRSRNN